MEAATAAEAAAAAGFEGPGLGLLLTELPIILSKAERGKTIESDRQKGTAEIYEN